MKKKLLTILSCLIMFVCILTGCGNKGLQGGPVAEDTVYGNGGHVVRKGDYICKNGYYIYSPLLVCSWKEFPRLVNEDIGSGLVI